MKVDVSNLNKFFNIEGDDYMEMGEEVFEPVQFGWAGYSGMHSEEGLKSIAEAASKCHKGKITSEETKRRISQSSKGISVPNRGAVGKNNVNSARWIIHHKCGKVTDIVGLSNWCKENGYTHSCLTSIARGERKYHKDIVKVEKI